MQERIGLDPEMGHPSLAGSLEKCIQNGKGAWFTPSEFAAEGKRGGKNWKRDIRCGEKSLRELLEVNGGKSSQEAVGSLPGMRRISRSRKTKELPLSFTGMMEVELSAAREA